VSYEVVRSRRLRLSALQPDIINGLMRDMHEEALAVVRQGSDAPDLLETRQAYMRYVGQGHEIAVNLPVENYGDDHAEVFLKAFETAYTHLYGRTIDGIDVEALSWTLTISAPRQAAASKEKKMKNQAEAKQSGEQSIFDPSTAARVAAPVFLREQLHPGDCISGPALITEDQTTTVVSSAYDASIDGRGYVVLTHREASRDE